MRPIFTVVVGSAGRETLQQTIESFLEQDRALEDRLIVVFDSFEKSPEDIEALYQHMMSPPCNRYRADPSVLMYAYDSGYHWLGVEQINWTLRNLILNQLLPSTHVFTMGDDDVLAKDAFAVLRPLCAKEPLRPILYQFVAPWRRVLWDLPRLKMSHISGCCIAAPTRFVREMPTRKYVEHDYDWIVDIVDRSGVDPLWLEKVLMIARPDVGTGWGAATAPPQERISHG